MLALALVSAQLFVLPLSWESALLFDLTTLFKSVQVMDFKIPLELISAQMIVLSRLRYDILKSKITYKS